MSLYEEIRDAGIPLGHHRADIYFKATDDALAILAKYPLLKARSRRFVNKVSKEVWVHISSACDPLLTAEHHRQRPKRLTQKHTPAIPEAPKKPRTKQ